MFSFNYKIYESSEANAECKRLFNANLIEYCDLQIKAFREQMKFLEKTKNEIENGTNLSVAKFRAIAAWRPTFFDENLPVNTGAFASSSRNLSPEIVESSSCDSSDDDEGESNPSKKRKINRKKCGDSPSDWSRNDGDDGGSVAQQLNLSDDSSDEEEGDRNDFASDESGSDSDSNEPNSKRKRYRPPVSDISDDENEPAVNCANDGEVTSSSPANDSPQAVKEGSVSPTEKTPKESPQKSAPKQSTANPSERIKTRPVLPDYKSGKPVPLKGVKKDAIDASNLHATLPEETAYVNSIKKTGILI